MQFAIFQKVETKDQYQIIQSLWSKQAESHQIEYFRDSEVIGLSVDESREDISADEDTELQNNLVKYLDFTGQLETLRKVLS